jgi:uncharacterized membrane protein YqjE
LALLTQTVGWVVDHFLANLGMVEKTSSSIRVFAQTMAEGAVLIVLGLFAGLWVVRRKRQSCR